MEKLDLRYKNPKEVLISIIVGFSIGLSVIIPGISGSTIAMVLKVYDKLMYSFSNVFKRFKDCILFLIPIIFGIGVGFILGFILVKALLEVFPFITICFFVGLMIGTYPILFKEIKGEKVTNKKVGLFTFGILIPLCFALTSVFAGASNTLVDIGIGHYALFLVIGILVSLTQLVPGLSATALLMILGYYTALINGISRTIFSNIRLMLVYVVMVVGFVIGTLLFSKIIDKLLNNFRKPFFFTICGLSVGSIISVFLGNDCMGIYKSWGDSIVRDIVFGVIFLAVGFGFSFVFYIVDKKKTEASQNMPK
jgi:putative membrane protein